MTDFIFFSSTFLYFLQIFKINIVLSGINTIQIIKIRIKQKQSGGKSGLSSFRREKEFVSVHRVNDAVETGKSK